MHTLGMAGTLTVVSRPLLAFKCASSVVDEQLLQLFINLLMCMQGAVLHGQMGPQQQGFESLRMDAVA